MNCHIYLFFLCFSVFLISEVLADCDYVNTSGCKCNTNDAIGGLKCGYELNNHCLPDPSSIFQCNPGGTQNCRYGSCTYGCCGTGDGHSYCCKDSTCSGCPPGHWYKKKETSTSVPSSSSPPPTTTTTDCNNPAPNSCSFYTSCLENKFHCGPMGYPINYGDKNCRKFINAMNKFSSAGKKWVTDTMLCLQKALISTYKNNKTTCSEISNTAFNSHASCYITSGVCFLPPTDWGVIFETVSLKDIFGSKQAFTQALETASHLTLLGHPSGPGYVLRLWTGREHDKFGFNVTQDIKQIFPGMPRTHVTSACTNCQKRRGRCSGTPCTSCVKRGLNCVFKPGKKRGPKPKNEVVADATLFTQKQEYDPGPYVSDNQQLCNGIINSMQKNVRTTSTEYLNYLNQEQQLYNNSTITPEVIDRFQADNAMINSHNARFNHESTMVLSDLYFFPFIGDRLEHSEYQHDNLSLAYNSGTITQEIFDPFRVDNAMINSQNAGFNHESIMALPDLYFVPFIGDRLEHSEYQHDNLSLAYNSDHNYVAPNFNPNRGHSH
ncbi:6456_t:CDS:2 [Dentiscutata heterogama]|uniref:6456_t:CDS:1 n=1 Tax=Dentiscutata heterogama TaxID=1316150 RepID=A0ACA9KFY4_9GLOM|nr:6456_t:CDS:2 [Dentiscutata heterogama]